MLDRIYAPKTLASPFRLLDDATLRQIETETTHICRGGTRCVTDAVGYPTPGNRAPLSMVVDATQGFIPLWDQNVTLNWRFNEASLRQFENPEAVASFVRTLLGEALLAWSPAVPVRFSETKQPWDFEIMLRRNDDCDHHGRCALASAFFPDGGRHALTLYPQLFRTDRREQIETMAHELGHIFGLRHFFAQTSERAFPSEIFGSHKKFTIMNYGPDSRLTDTDVSDVIALYSSAWSGKLRQINGTPIQLVRPYSALPVKPSAPLPVTEENPGSADISECQFP